MQNDLVIAANRGPHSFVRNASGELTTAPGGGGLASALGPMVRGSGATWIATAMTDADREAAARGAIETDGFRYRCIAIDPAVYDAAYNTISNATLWFLHHRLWDLARQPTFDREWRGAWEAYRTVNRTFAEVIATEAPEDATVLIQDYHLCLAATWLGKARPDVRMVHFHHIPFATPEELSVLPRPIAAELLEGLAAHHACGFHTRRWADAFRACCEEVLGHPPRTFVAPLGPDEESFAAVEASDACVAAGRALTAAVGDRRMMLRVDRAEPSKNVLRGFAAFDQLLEAHPEWVGRVVFVALVYPSRQAIPEYATYRRDVEAAAADLNQRWGTPDWMPVILDTRDDFARSVAALQRYDVLLVNPIRDGLNLVAKEGPMLNRADGVLLLSTEAGAWDEMSEVALAIDPFDVSATAEQMASALEMSDSDRHDRAVATRAAATRRSPKDWLADQLAER